jgi:hypothetical protein
MEDIVQTLIDLRLAYTGTMTYETHVKQQDVRYRRRPRVTRDTTQSCDSNNNDLDSSSSFVTIDEDALRAAMQRLSASNLPAKYQQNIFDATYLRLINRR